MLNQPHPQVLVHAGRLSLPPFAILLTLGLLAALTLSLRTARKAGIDPDTLWNTGLCAILTAYILSRVLLFASHPQVFSAAPILLFAVPSLSAAGLGLTAAATMILLVRQRVPIRAALDAWTTPAAVAATFAELGLALSHAALALPAAACSALLAAGSYLWLGRAHTPGRPAGAFLILSGLATFLITLAETSGNGATSFGLDTPQAAALAAIAAGGVLLASTV